MTVFLVILITQWLSNLTHPVNFPCGRKPEYPEKTHDIQHLLPTRLTKAVSRAFGRKVEFSFVVSDSEGTYTFCVLLNALLYLDTISLSAFALHAAKSTTEFLQVADKLVDFVKLQQVCYKTSG